MSRVAVASVAFTAALLNFLPLPAQTALVIHGHPQKASYASPAEWPCSPSPSSQGHWGESNTQPPAHTHLEPCGPWWAEMPRQPFSIKVQVQLFHTDGYLGGIYGWGLREIVWDTPGPMVGDPHGLVVRSFTAIFDPAVAYVDGNGNQTYMPENGKFNVRLQAYTVYTTGAMASLEVFRPLWIKGDPAVPETPNQWMFGTRNGMFPPAGRESPGFGHGTAVSECIDQYLPILAPVTTRTTVDCLGWSYAAADAEWPTNQPGHLAHVLDADLHNGIPGTTVQSMAFPINGQQDHHIQIVFDPAVGTGTHKNAVTWCQKTGTGTPGAIRAGEELCSLLVMPFTVGTGGPGPGPGPTPVDCAGTKAWIEVTPGAWHQVFTVTQQPANGGKSCAVVANGG